MIQVVLHLSGVVRSRLFTLLLCFVVQMYFVYCIKETFGRLPGTY